MKIPLNFSANLSFMFCDLKLSLTNKIKLASKIGFNAVECASPYELPIEYVNSARNKAKVKIAMINTPTGECIPTRMGYAALPGYEEKFRVSIHIAIEYAVALDCKLIHILASVIEGPNIQNDKTYVDNLRYAVNLFEANGLTGLIEPINPNTVPNYYLNDYDKALRIIKEINSPSLRLQLDIFHLQQINGNLTKNIERLIPFTGHIQIAQVPDRHEPDTPGEIDYSYVFSVIKRCKYSGFIGLEYKPKNDSLSGLTWITNQWAFIEC